MARTKAVLGAGARLSDFLAASLLARAVPADVVHAALDEHGCNSQRIRSFPAVAGVYYCMALSLYPEAAYEEVFAVVSQTPGSSRLSIFSLIAFFIIGAVMLSRVDVEKGTRAAGE